MDDRKTPAERVIYSIAWIVGIIGFVVLSCLFVPGEAVKLIDVLTSNFKLKNNG
jgi:hypothetical protein